MIAGATSSVFGGKDTGIFKDMCDMANGVGRPDLVYKFLSISANNALWNSRRGASFGLEAILQTEARDQLAPHLNALSLSGMPSGDAQSVSPRGFPVGMPIRVLA